MAQQNIVSGEVVRSELKNFYDKPVTRVSVELVLSLVTVMFFALFALRPTLNTMSQLVKEIEDKQKVDQALTKKIAALSTAQSEYMTYKERFTILESAVQSNLKLDDVLFYIEYMAGKSGIKLTGLRIKQFPVGQIGETSSEEQSEPEVTTSAQQPVVKTPAKKQSIGIYEISLSFSGEYQKMLSFFAEMERTRPLFSVQGFSFSTRRDRDNVYHLSANATVYAYGYLDAGAIKNPTLEKVKPKVEEPAL